MLKLLLRKKKLLIKVREKMVLLIKKKELNSSPNVSKNIDAKVEAITRDPALVDMKEIGDDTSAQKRLQENSYKKVGERRRTRDY